MPETKKCENLKNDFLKELLRKTLSIILAAIFVGGTLYIKSVYGLNASLNIILMLLLIFLIVDYLRVDLGLRLPLYNSTQRKKELCRLHGITYYMVAAIVVFVFFEFKIALAALLMSIFCDAASSLVGKGFGRKKLWRKKTIEGSIAGLIANVIVGIVILDNALIIIVMSLAASAIELVVDKLDDNLYVTVFAAAVGHLLTLI